MGQQYDNNKSINSYVRFSVRRNIVSSLPCKIYNAAFEIIPYSNNSLTEKLFTDIHTRESLKTIYNHV